MKITIVLDIDDAACEALFQKEGGEERHVLSPRVSTLMAKIVDLVETEMDEEGIVD